MPVFAAKEIVDNKENLFHHKNISDERLEILYRRFGGSIRHWAQPSENSAWKELETQMEDVARNGSIITQLGGRAE